MKKIGMRALSLALAGMIAAPVYGFAADNTKEYTVKNPYAEVVWSGDNAWGAYKGSLHTHSSISDADTNLREMVMDHYEQGYDFLAMTDHGVTGKAWNEKATQLPLYLYQWIIGLKPNRLTDEEFLGVTTGTYPVNGVPRGKKMTCVTGGNELNALTITKCHVNGMFLPEGVGDNYLGYENDHEGAVKLADEAGGISFINHPGDWLKSNSNPDVVNDPEMVHYYSNIFLKYDSCYGMEVFNERNGPTGYDRILWDNVLMECLPYGKTIIGYSNTDAHWHAHVDSSYSIFMMEDNTVENIKKTMMNGAFFCITRVLRANEKFGPAENMDVSYSEVPVPTFTDIKVEGHTVTVKAKDFYNLQWVANGNVIASQDVTQSSEEYTYTLNLDEIPGAEDFLYIRAQLLGEGGINCSQAFVIDDGSEPLTYVVDNSREAKWEAVKWKLSSLRICVLFQKIIDAIKD